MIKRTLIVAMACTGLVLGSLAEARDDRGRDRGQGRGHGHSQYGKSHDRDRGQWRGPSAHRGHDRGQWQHGPSARRDLDRGQWRGPSYREGFRDGYRAAPPRVVHRGWGGPPPHAGRWMVGSRLPGYGHGGYYPVVHNWHSYRLARPHPGYHWVQVGPEFLLIAAATGVITSIILNQ